VLYSDHEELNKCRGFGKVVMDTDKLTKRLWEELERELKEFYEFIDQVAPPPEEDEIKKGSDLWKS